MEDTNRLLTQNTMKLSKSPVAHATYIKTTKGFYFNGGDDRDRTGDLWLAKPPLSQLSYIPSQRVDQSHHSNYYGVGSVPVNSNTAR